MASLYSLKTTAQNVVMVISLLALPPIVEELALRHFLLSILPFKANRKIAVVAVVTTTRLFSVQHRHYDNLTTYLLLFALGVVFAWARIRSNGIALPIAHCPTQLCRRIGADLRPSGSTYSGLTGLRQDVKDEPET